MTAPHLYVECDIPEQMTLAEWRRAKPATRGRLNRVRRALGLV